MSTYGDYPYRVLLANRTQTPTLDQLQSQVNSLARILVDVQDAIKGIGDLSTIVASLNISSLVSAQSRALNSDFTISSTRNAIAFYTIELSVSQAITGTDTVAVDMFLNSISVGRVKKILTVTLGLGIAITNTDQKLLIGFVPAGSTVNLTSSGTGTATLNDSLELLL